MGQRFSPPIIGFETIDSTHVGAVVAMDAVMVAATIKTTEMVNPTVTATDPIKKAIRYVFLFCLKY